MAQANNVEDMNGGSLDGTGVQLGVGGEVLIGGNVVFASVNLDDAYKVRRLWVDDIPAHPVKLMLILPNYLIKARMILNGGERWNGMTHFSVDENVREDIKRALDIQVVHIVPFCSL